jgi:hypothetical protein
MFEKGTRLPPAALSKCWLQLGEVFAQGYAPGMCYCCRHAAGHAAAPANIYACGCLLSLQKAPTREGVPFVLVRDTSLFERKEVKDVMAYAQ